MVIDSKPRDHEIGSVLAPSLQDELLAYQGRWVAMTKTALVAVGDSPDEVLHAAAAKGVARPILYFVPGDGQKSLFF